jgi:hypothetical protein
MNEEKQKALEAAGWRVGDAEKFDGEVVEADPIAATTMQRRDDELAPLSARATAPFESVHLQGDPNTIQWWATGSNMNPGQSTTERKLNLKLENPTATEPPTQPYNNPLAALRRERKIKSGKAAALLGISRQRLHVVEHATKPLRCMAWLLAKAKEVWRRGDEMATTAPRKESH